MPNRTNNQTTELPDWAESLPKGHLACESCGVSVRVTATTPTVELEAPLSAEALGLYAASVSRTAPEARAQLGQPPRGRAIRFARCEECRARAEQVHGQGVELSSEVLDALGAAGLTRVPRLSREWVDALTRQLDEVAEGLSYTEPTALAGREGLACREPWAHVPEGEKEALRQGLARWAAERAAEGQPDVQVPPPGSWAGCLMCGVAGVSMTARQVAAVGGLEAAQAAVWRPATVSPAALLGSGPELLAGGLCPACAEAVSKASGIVGGRAIERAVLDYLRAEGYSEFAAVRAVELRETPTQYAEWHLPGWGGVAASRAARAARAARGEQVRGPVEPLAPNREPWQHLGILDAAREWSAETAVAGGGNHAGR